MRLQLLNLNLNVILFQPVIHLQQICNGLRCIHKLSIPWNRAILTQQLLQLFSFYELQQRLISLCKKLLHLSADKLTVFRMPGLRIRAFFPPEHLIRKQTLDCFPQQSLFIALIILEFPWNAIQIFRNTHVTEGYPYLQGIVHGHTVFAIQQRLHEPFHIQIHHFTKAPFFLCAIAQDITLLQCLLIALIDIGDCVDLLRKLLVQKAHAVFCGLCPWKAIGGANLRIAVPRRG